MSPRKIIPHQTQPPYERTDEGSDFYDITNDEDSSSTDTVQAFDERDISPNGNIDDAETEDDAVLRSAERQFMSLEGEDAGIDDNLFNLTIVPSSHSDESQDDEIADSEIWRLLREEDLAMEMGVTLEEPETATNLDNTTATPATLSPTSNIPDVMDPTTERNVLSQAPKKAPSKPHDDPDPANGPPLVQSLSTPTRIAFFTWCKKYACGHEMGADLLKIIKHHTFNAAELPFTIKAVMAMAKQLPLMDVQQRVVPVIRKKVDSSYKEGKANAYSFLVKDVLGRELASPQIWDSLYFGLGIEADMSCEAHHGVLHRENIATSISEYPIRTKMGKGTVFPGAFFNINT